MLPPRPTVYIETYGCQMNVSDSELMLGKLIESGYESVAEPDGADVILINTCAIREHAEQRVIGRIGEMKSRMKQGAVVGVTGCMAQRLGTKLLDRAKHVSLVIGPDGYRDLPSLIESARRGVRTTATDFDLEEHYEDFTPRRFEGCQGVDTGSAGLRLQMHLLHRADHTRARAKSPPRRGGTRDRGRRRVGNLGDSPAWTDGELILRWRA